MLIPPELLALFAAICTATYDILVRVCIKRGCSAVSVGFFNSIAGGLLLLIVFPLPSLLGLTTPLALTLLGSSTLWAAMVYFDIRAYEELDASINAILNSLRFALLTLAGLFLFGESISLLGWLGILLLLLSIYHGVKLPEIKSNRSLWYRGLSILSGTFAIILDKHLTNHIDSQLVLVTGYLVPCFLFACMKPQVVIGLKKEVNKSGKILLVCAVVYALLGYCFVHGFGSGELWTTVAIYRTRIVFVLLLAYFFLKEREEIKRRASSSFFCLIGALLVAFA